MRIVISCDFAAYHSFRGRSSAEQVAAYDGDVSLGRAAGLLLLNMGQGWLMGGSGSRNVRSEHDGWRDFSEIAGPISAVDVSTPCRVGFTNLQGRVI
jgi:hypothetical protein